VIALAPIAAPSVSKILTQRMVVSFVMPYFLPLTMAAIWVPSGRERRRLASVVFVQLLAERKGLLDTNAVCYNYEGKALTVLPGHHNTSG
jgi:hypothetical protein